MNELKPGTIITSTLWPEPIVLQLVEDLGDQLIRIVGSTALSNEHVENLITREQFKEIFTSTQTVPLMENPGEVFLALETIRYRFASLYDPLLAMNISKVNPLPHQIEAVYGHILHLPRIRFLIADDPGAGKTIMAGLIIKELKLRHLAKRILIVCPGHLKDQWYRELSEKFKEKFAVIDRAYFDLFPGENVWMRENQVITSIDFAKRDEIRPTLEAVHYDLAIVDEAHKMSAYRYGDKTDKTGRYKLGECLSKITEHLLFLTATPHKGDKENYRLFLDLLYPGFFATGEMVEESIRTKDNPLFIRRIKEDLKNFDGTPLFLPRNVQTLKFNLGKESHNEKELYNELSKYVTNLYGKALEKNRNIAFALTILQRRFASSTYALLQSLKRRKVKLEELYEQSATRKTRTDGDYFDQDENEDMTEEERWKWEELLEGLSTAGSREELKLEIDTLGRLMAMAREIINNESERKLSQLKESLQVLHMKFSDPKDKKILIFTESRDTLEYLEKKTRAWGYKTTVIHGGMKLQDRINAEAVFKNEADILIATEAAGEGINLQFCHMMINYDIPWNPNRLEQRMGRIHRYGQQMEVFIYNLVAEDTREGRVLSKLFEKLMEIKAKLGSDKVFDVISDVFHNRDLWQLLIDAAANARNMNDILKDIDIVIDEEYIARVKENLGESLATHIIDYTHIKEISRLARERRLIPEYTENFFKKAFAKLGGKYKDRQDGFMAIETIPFKIQEIAEGDIFKKTYGSILKKYPRITFDKEIAFKTPDVEFISFGHPLFEAVLDCIEKNYRHTLLNGAVFSDPDGKMNGYILFYEGVVKDGRGKIAGKRLFSFYIADGNARPIPPSIVWDLDVNAGSPYVAGYDPDHLKESVKPVAFRNLQTYREELLELRNRQCEIKEKYGASSLDYLILKLDRELIDLYARRDAGENVDLVIRNKEESKKGYEHARDELIETIAKEKSLAMEMPRFLGVIRVVPAPGLQNDMRTDLEIERIGVDVVMKYETDNARFPENVSEGNLGFDIRSTGQDGSVRYIEVKARSQTGSVALTQNEWFKAHRFGDDYYLYVVMNAASEPMLSIYRNPVHCLEPSKVIDAVRYIIPFEQLKEKGEAV